MDGFNAISWTLSISRTRLRSFISSTGLVLLYNDALMLIVLLLCNRINYYNLRFRYNNFTSELYSHRQIFIYLSLILHYFQYYLLYVRISRSWLRIHIKRVTRIDRGKYNIFYVRKSASVYIMYVFIASLRLVCGKYCYL